MQRAGGAGRRKQATGRQKAAAVITAASADRQASLAEKLLLEQSIARVVGGQTGLLMALDMLLHDAEEKDSAGFLCHAEGYLRRAEKLEPLFVRYKKTAGPGAESALYDSLLKVGRNLRRKLSEMPPEGLSDRELDTWRKSVLRHMELYGERGPAGGGGPEEGHGRRDAPGG